MSCNPGGALPPPEMGRVGVGVRLRTKFSPRSFRGAREASEPGIQFRRDFLLNWIPGSRLRRAPE
jgi:hypothetical protein